MDRKGSAEKASGGSARKKLRQQLKQRGVIQQGGISKKKKLANAVNRKAKNAAASENNEKNKSLEAMNPFELKITKPKHEVLNNKVKGILGKPAHSRSRAIEIRKNTLLKEYQSRDKVRSFVDRRFGERDESLTEEEKMLERFTMEKQSRERKSNLFNLGEEEELTHLGRSLSTFDDFNDDLHISDEDEEGIGKDMVAKAHFGGFEGEEEEEGEGRPKTKQEIMMELIAKSKFHKQQRQEQKIQDMELIDKLNEEFDEIRSLMNTGKSQPTSGGQYKPDTYDLAVVELAKDKRARPTDRLKTEEEILLEEREKLMELEKQRQLRMKGIDPTRGKEQKDKPSLLSGDDLGGNLALDDQNLAVAYDKHGRLINADQFIKSKKRRAEDDDDVEEEEEEEDEEEGKETEKDSDNEEELEEGEEGEDEDEDSDEEEEGEEEAEEESDLSDLEEEVQKPLKSSEKLEKEEKEEVVPATSKKSKKETELIKQTMIAEAKAQLPYTFEAPENHDAFLELVSSRTTEELSVIVHRIRVCHPIKLKAENKPKMELFFSTLLEYFVYLGRQHPLDVPRMQSLLKPILEMLTPANAPLANDFARSRLMELHEQLTIDLTKESKSGFPTLGVMLEFILYCRMFPTSDFQHYVTTPLFMLIAQILGTARFLSLRDIAAALFLCNLAFEYQKLAKRMMPEALGCLHRIIQLLSPIPLPSSAVKHMPQFETIRELAISPAKLGEKARNKKYTFEKFSILRIQTLKDNSDKDHSIRLSLLSICLDIVKFVSKLYEEFPAYVEAFTPFEHALQHLSALEGLPSVFMDLCKDVLSNIQETIGKVHSHRRDNPLRLQQHKPIALKEYTPKFDDNYNLERKTNKNKQDDIQTLKRQYKKELKGARRELKKDNLFLAETRMKERAEKDAEYNKKIKSVYGMIEKEKGEMTKNEKAKLKKRRKIF